MSDENSWAYSASGILPCVIFGILKDSARVLVPFGMRLPTCRLAPPGIRATGLRSLVAGCLLIYACSAESRINRKPGNAARSSAAVEDLLRMDGASGPFGGSLTTAQKAEPETFNPVSAVMTGTRDILGLLHADLIHINRRTLKTEPALAKTWEVSPDGRVYTVHLRRGIRFSDGHLMDADDVVFTFRVQLDRNVRSVQRDLLVINGRPMTVNKVDALTIRFVLPAPYAAAERLFDSIAILPRHLLADAYAAGKLTRAWGLESAPAEMAGLGPFQLQEYIPGQRVILRRNPCYWKTNRDGKRLPFLDRIVIQFIPSEDAQILRLRSQELDLIDAITSRNFVALRSRQEAQTVQLFDAGPGLEYNFLVFNLNQLPDNAGSDARRRYAWFSQLSFRRAVSAAIDRQSVVRLVYRGLGEPLSGYVTEGNPSWLNRTLPTCTRSLPQACELLRRGSFSWRDGELFDPQGNHVEFSLLVSASNSDRLRIATIVQDDLRQIGMKVSVVTMDAKSVQDRILNRGDYDSAIMTLASGDADPNTAINVWAADGRLRMWNRRPGVSGWEKEVDSLMRRQMTTLEYNQRKVMYDRVQQVIAEELPIICIASPHVLAAASRRIRGLQPAHVRPYTLWNAELLSLDQKASEP